MRLPRMLAPIAIGLVAIGHAVAPGALGCAAQAPVSTPGRLSPAAALQIRVVDGSGDSAPLLDPQAEGWQKVPATRVLVSRTPRIYQTEPTDQPPLPSLAIRALRVSSKLVLRLEWTDATRNAPEAPPARSGEAGVPERIYKRPTAETSTFTDAAAVMLPEKWTGPGFPSLVMGDQQSPALLYYWSASRGAELVKATGRATTNRIGGTFPTQASHSDGRWALTMVLPDSPDGYPIAFALWDGQYADRDGMKCFSVWYVLTGTERAATTATGALDP